MRLYKHQKAAIQRAKQGNLALFHECGTGKTLTALRIIEHWKKTLKKTWHSALVVCPRSIIAPAWMADAARFTPALSVVSLRGKDSADRLRRLKEPADVYVVNFETFRTMFDALSARDFSLLIVDESSKMKSPDSQITRALLALAGVASRGKSKKFAIGKVIPYRYVLSGTPAPNDRREYWAQMNLVSPGQAFSDNYYSFRCRYFTPTPLGRTGINLWTFTQNPALVEEFASRMAPYCDVVSKRDAVDLPSQVHLVRQVELDSAERQAYDTLHRDLAIRFANEEVLAASALVEVMKSRQLTSGFCYGSDCKHYITGTSKLTELLALLEEIGERPVIIWCSFRYEMSKILTDVPYSAVLTGTDQERHKVITDFTQGRIRTLIANPQSAGHGLTFTNCSYAVYFSLTWSYELAKQSQDRIHRIGQHHKCTYYYLVAKDTIDEVIFDAVRHKKNLSENVLDYLKHSRPGGA
jgi:SNF2 family DNA or RNA helicase